MKNHRSSLEYYYRNQKRKRTIYGREGNMNIYEMILFNHKVTLASDIFRENVKRVLEYRDLTFTDLAKYCRVGTDIFRKRAIIPLEVAIATARFLKVPLIKLCGYRSEPWLEPADGDKILELEEFATDGE